MAIGVLPIREKSAASTGTTLAQKVDIKDTRRPS